MKRLLKGIASSSAFLFVLFAFWLFPVDAYASSLDHAYGTNGYTLTSFGSLFTYGGQRMDIQPDDKPVVVGFVDNGSSWDWRIVRYNTDGTLDATFGNNGSVSKDFGRTDSLAAVKVQ